MVIVQTLLLASHVITSCEVMFVITYFVISTLELKVTKTSSFIQSVLSYILETLYVLLLTVLADTEIVDDSTISA